MSILFSIISKSYMYFFGQTLFERKGDGNLFPDYNLFDEYNIKHRFLLIKFLHNYVDVGRKIS